MLVQDFALLGKLSHEADFHREGVHDEAEMIFFRWLVEAHALTSSKGEPLERTLGFAFHHGQGEGARWVVGVMVPSHDAVGRRFPLAATRSIPEREVGQAFAAIPEAWHAPLVGLRDAVEARREGRTSVAPIADPPPLFATWSAASHRLESARLGELHERLLGGEEGAAYAYGALLSPLGRHPRVLVCPLAEGDERDDTYHWLELIRRAHGRPALFAWTGGRAPRRLLVSLGEPSPWLLAALTRPDAEPSVIWPLETTSELARERAREALGHRLPAPERPVSALFESLFSPLGTR